MSLLNYRRKEEQQALFDALASTYPNLMSSKVIGNSVQGRPIKMYRIGNSGGGKILFDGCIHGASDLATEVYYLYAKWLLESGNPEAKRILQRNCTLIIPTVNMDTHPDGSWYIRRNGNLVDLNRNFTYRWTSAGSTDPKSVYYRGPSPASEPATKALKNVFKNEKPILYINGHTFGGMPGEGILIGYSDNPTFNDQLYTKYNQLRRQMGVEAFPYSKGGIQPGFATADASLDGIYSWLIEMIGGERPPFDRIKSFYLPKFLPLAIAFSQEIEIIPTSAWERLKAWWNGLTGWQKALILTSSLGSVVIGGSELLKKQ